MDGAEPALLHDVRAIEGRAVHGAGVRDLDEDAGRTAGGDSGRGAVMGETLSVTTCHLGPRVLKGYPRRALVLLIFGALLARWGVAMLRTPGCGQVPDGSLLLVVGVIAVVVGVVLLLHPRTLILDEDGFLFRQTIGRSRTERWSDCGAFIVVEGPTHERVAFHSSSARGALPRSAPFSRTQAGVDGALPDRIGGLRADKLAILLNRYREHYAAPDNAAATGM